MAQQSELDRRIEQRTGATARLAEIDAGMKYFEIDDQGVESDVTDSRVARQMAIIEREDRAIAELKTDQSSL